MWHVLGCPIQYRLILCSAAAYLKDYGTHSMRFCAHLMRCTYLSEPSRCRQWTALKRATWATTTQDTKKYHHTRGYRTTRMGWFWARGIYLTWKTQSSGGRINFWQQKKGHFSTISDRQCPYPFIGVPTKQESLIIILNWCMHMQTDNLPVLIFLKNENLFEWCKCLHFVDSSIRFLYFWKHMCSPIFTCLNRSWYYTFIHWCYVFSRL